MTLVNDVPTDQTLTLVWDEAEQPSADFDFFPPNPQPFFQKVNTLIDYTHQENTMVDFDRDRLTYHMLSTEGPKAAFGDVNGDGLEDAYIGGAKGFAGQLLFQVRNGSFQPSSQSVFESDKISEDTDAISLMPMGMDIWIYL